MTAQEQIKAIAELAELILPNGELVEDYCWWQDFIWSVDNGMPDKIWNPLASHDTINPVIEKWINLHDANYLRLCDAIRVMFRIHGTISPRILIEMTASQWCEVLLRATGKWKPS